LIDVREVVEQALKITELQTRAMGISVHQTFPVDAIMVRGQFNSLAQAMRNFLQTAQEAIAERIKSGDRAAGEIKVELIADPDTVNIEIKDNGISLDLIPTDHGDDPIYTIKDLSDQPGLGLSVAQQIIRDHGGSLEIRSSKGAGTQAKISLPRPVFES
jgi:C4-dicarboxylate-specific signal transduction histidine kinase